MKKNELIKILKSAKLVPVTWSEYCYGVRKTEVYCISGTNVHINLGSTLSFWFDFGGYGQTCVGCQDSTLYCSIGTASMLLNNYLDCKITEELIYNSISL